MIAAYSFSAREKLCGMKRLGGMAEHPVEDRVDVLEMIAEVEQLFELLARQPLRHLWVGLEQLEQRQLAVRFPHLHRVALDERIGVFAAEARLGQRQKHPLRVDEAAHA